MYTKYIYGNTHIYLIGKEAKYNCIIYLGLFTFSKLKLNDSQMWYLTFRLFDTL